MKRLYTLLLIVGCVLSINAQSPCFYAPQTATYSTFFNPNGIATADFNSDGHLDLAVSCIDNTSSSSSPRIKLFFGNSTGAFTSTSSINTDEQVKSIEAADVNNDGHKDILACMGENSSSFNNNGLKVFINNGLGVFNPVGLFANHVCSMPGMVAALKIDGDQYLDFVGTSSCTPSFRAFINDGVGGVSSNTAFVSPIAGVCTDIYTDDFNKDGYTDIATTHRTSNVLTIFNGAAVSPFSNPVTFPVGNAPNALDGADLNNDTYTDLIVLNSLGNSYSVFLGGVNGFNTSTSYTLSGQPAALSINDFNADGIKDLAITFFSLPTITGTLSVFSGNGNGTFTLAKQLTVGNRPYFIKSEDINADGKKDIITANYQSNTINVWLNDIPTLAAVSSNSIICSGSSAMLSASGATSYLWNTGSTNSSIVVSPSITTVYSFTGTTANNCSAVTSISQNVSICSEITESGGVLSLIKFYPNPTQSELIMENPLNESVSITVCNLMGQSIYQTTLSASSTQIIKTEMWASGVYLCTIQLGNTPILYQRIVKQ
jgi:hypothetical protein